MALQQTIAMLLALVSVQVLLTTLIPVAMARRSEPLRIFCSMLPKDECAFSVDSAGHRCVLKTISRDMNWHVCQTSDILVSGGSPVEYIETQECANACGVAKLTVGLSTDSLESEVFTSKLCSFECQVKCPNLVDLYTNLAAGEGRSLKLMCSNHQHQSWDRPLPRRKEQEDHVSLDEEHPSLDEDHVSLDEEHPSLDDDHVSLDEEHPSLDEDHVSLDEEHPSLDEDHVSLDEEHPSLDEEHPSLDEDHVSLDEEHPSLDEDHVSLEEVHPSFYEDHASLDAAEEPAPAPTSGL